MGLLGYTRVSPAMPHTGLQVSALAAAGVEPRDVFSDVTSTARRATNRAGMRRVLQTAEAGDTLVVWRIDCLGRSVVDVVNTVAMLRERGIQLRSLEDGIDPETTGGLLMLDLLVDLAEYERELVAERRSARARTTARQGGAKVGRPPADPGAARAKLRAVEDARARGLTAADAAQLVGWSRATFYRHRQEDGSQE